MKTTKNKPTKLPEPVNGQEWTIQTIKNGKSHGRNIYKTNYKGHILTVTAPHACSYIEIRLDGQPVGGPVEKHGTDFQDRKMSIHEALVFAMDTAEELLSEQIRSTFSYDAFLDGSCYKSDEEKQANIVYHKGRVMFAFVDGILHYAVNDPRDHIQWLNQDFGITKEAFETIPRGNCIQNIYEGFRCIMYQGIRHDDTIITLDMLEQARDMIKKCCGSDYATVYNGVIPGKTGTPWLPKTPIARIYHGEIMPHTA